MSTPQLLDFVTEPVSPGPWAKATMARHLELVLSDGTVRWLRPWNGETSEQQAHQAANRGTGVYIRIAGMPAIEGGPKKIDPVMLYMDFQVAAVGLQRKTADDTAHDVAWQIRQALRGTADGVPFINDRLGWRYENALPVLETTACCIRSLVMHVACALRDWDAK